MTSNHKLPPLHIHPILYFFLLIAIITGMFIEFLTIFFIVLFHELGHYFCARIFKWRIRRIFLWIFGGVMETDEYGTRPLKEEWLVTLAGPFQHVIIYLILLSMEHFNLLPASTLHLAYQYNTIILIGNLLPIWPLDGGKLVQLSLDTVLSYQQAHRYMLFFSCCTIVGVMVYCYMQDFLSLSLLLLISFLLWENRLEWRRRYFKWWRFLWHRYSTNKVYRKQVELNVTPSERVQDIFKHFRRDTSHLITVCNQAGETQFISEKDCLNVLFTKRNPNIRIEYFL